MGPNEKKNMDKNIALLVKPIKVTFILGENARFEVYFMYPFPS